MSRKSIILLLATIFVASGAGLVIPKYFKPRMVASKNACMANLRLIEGAKDYWALNNGKTTNDIPTRDEVRQYLKEAQIPNCPGGGSYIVGRVGEDPRCSIGGPEHSLHYDYAKEKRHRLLMISLTVLSGLGFLIAIFAPRKMKAPEKGT